MRKATVWRALALAGFLVAGRAHSAGPPLEVLSGSTITLGVAGALRAIAPQSLELGPTPAGGAVAATRDALALPRVYLAFGEFVDLWQNQEMRLALDPVSGAATLELELWLADSDGNRVVLPTTLTTGTPATTDCSGYAYCTGGPGDPHYCDGVSWDTATGDLRLVGVARIPFGSNTTVDCSPVLLVLEARIDGADGDADTVLDAVDVCPADPDAGQADADADGVGDACDNCVAGSNARQNDADADGIGDACEGLWVNFQPAAAPIPAGYTADSAQPFSPGTGRGWLDAAGLQVRDREMLADQRFDTLVFTTDPRTWEGTLPPRLWDLELTLGDPAYGHGPQRLVAEEEVAFDGETTAAGECLTAVLPDRLVADGRLSVAVGGGGGSTALDYLHAVESAQQPFLHRTINFQPAASALPPGFVLDSGELYSAGAGFGWSAGGLLPRDRAFLGDPVLDTLMLLQPGTIRTWRLDLAPDLYRVHIVVGDPKFAQGPQSVVVEGQPWLVDAMTAAGEFLTLDDLVLVTDGALEVTFGHPAGATTVTTLSVASLAPDVDGDGVSNFVDNCVSVANPDQLDVDGDGIGEACGPDADQDGWSDALDNCPAVPNPAQTDGDGDAYGDACDCAPADGESFAEVEEVDGLVLGGGAPTSLSWSDQAAGHGAGTVYDVVSQTLSSLAASGAFGSASCLAADSDGPTLDDGRIPPVGDGYLYLVRAKNACGAGTYGAGNGSAARATLDTAGPCP